MTNDDLDKTRKEMVVVTPKANLDICSERSKKRINFDYSLL
jgi:hypothetical protein